MISTKYILIALPVIFLATIALASLVFSNIRHLSLPISEALGVLTIILPAVAAATLQGTYNFSRKSWNGNRKLITLPLLALIITQIIFETVIATLSLTYALPASGLDCALGEKWQILFTTKDEHAIRSIQDNFNCCGLNSVRDRAWPFSSNSPSSCSQTFGRSQSCLVPWRNAEQKNAVYMFLTVAVVFFTKNSDTRNRFITMEDDELVDEPTDVFSRLLIKDNNSRKAFKDIEGSNRSAENQGSTDHDSNTANTDLGELENEWRNEGVPR